MKNFQTHINVSRETIERLKTYETELIRWNRAINLVSKTTVNEIWDRHFLDSAQLWALRPTKIKNWLDVGSGAGFPGMVIAVLAAIEEPGLKVTLIESDLRKASFLTTVAKKLDLDVQIIPERIESSELQCADVISARALANLTNLLDSCVPHMAKNGQLLFLKGKKVETELTNAQKYWKFNTQLTQSKTDPDGKIVRIKDISRA